MKLRLVILLTVCALLGARLLGVHLHVLTQGQVSASAPGMHLAQFGEDSDVGHATEMELVGKNLSPSPLPLLPVGGGLLLLLMLLSLPPSVRLPRAPTLLGRRVDPRYRLGPPSQAPPY